MNLDDQLILGIVFIIAGVAMGLLAYAAFLNRREKSDEQEPAADEAAEQPASESENLDTRGPRPEDTQDGSMEDETVQAGAPTAAVEAEEPAVETPTQLAAPPEEQSPGVSPGQPAPSAPETHGAGAAGIAAKSTPADRASALLRRDPDTGRLRVDIGDNTYRSIEELRDSDDWKRVNDLFSDILAWLVKQEPIEEETSFTEEEDPADQPLNMIQQINEIIKEKLAEREGGPKAVRLMEGTDGSVRVYIGVDSYEMDEVPDEEAQAIIRQAVREWESRQ